MKQKDELLSMLEERGLTEGEIRFLVKLLAKIKAERRNADWDGAEAAVRSVLDEE